MKLPEHIERDYMRLRVSITQQVGGVIDEAMSLRTDSEDDPRLLELIALLGLTPATVINRSALRARLHRLAGRMSDFNLAQLGALIGRNVRKPNPIIIEEWVEQQTEAIVTSAQSFIERASVSLGVLALGAAASLVALNQLVTPEAARNAVTASSAALLLNARLVAASAQNAGSTHYRWVTEGDDTVRDHHAALAYSIQSWANPPSGGGTGDGDTGHPGDGINCRCTAEPVVQPTNVP